MFPMDRSTARTTLHATLAMPWNLARRSVLLWLVGFLLLVSTARAEHEGKLQILLLGDSSTQGSVPRLHDPKGPHLEDVIRLRLAEEKGLPPVNVINLGRGGEFIHRLLTSGRYDRDVAKLPGVDYVFVRYGICDHAYRENFPANFPKDYHELIARLRKDFPRATIVPMTVIPFRNPKAEAEINLLVRKVAEEERLPLLDLHPIYAAELKPPWPPRNRNSSRNWCN